MRVLIVKLSSMGDLVHTLPALTDAAANIPGIEFDWVSDEIFADIPVMHPAVKHVIKCAHRRWKKNKWEAMKNGELKTFYRQLRERPYDLIIDAQGNLKSAAITRLARGLRCGMDSNSVREWGAQFAYKRRFFIAGTHDLHVIMRTRLLFAQALGYTMPETEPEHGINLETLPKLSIELPSNYLVFLHSTTWDSKHWPERYWLELVKLATQAGYHVVLPWGGNAERERAERLAQVASGTTVLPRLRIAEQARILLGASGVVGLDTGLAHLAAALPVKGIHLYGPTDPNLLGVFNENQKYLSAEYPCAPCYLRECKFGPEAECFVKNLQPATVWAAMVEHLGS